MCQATQILNNITISIRIDNAFNSLICLLIFSLFSKEYHQTHSPRKPSLGLLLLVIMLSQPSQSLNASALHVAQDSIQKERIN